MKARMIGHVWVLGILVSLLAGCGSPASSISDSFDIQGHRGARGHVPENSLASFHAALDLGATTLEMDVVVSGDSQLIVSHEPWMSHEICLDTAGAPIPAGADTTFLIYEMTAAAVAAFDCGSKGNARFPDQQPKKTEKPRLTDVFDAIEKRASNSGIRPKYNIETKSHPMRDNRMQPDPEVFAGLLVDLVVQHGLEDHVTIQSFDPRTLIAAHRINPDLSIAFLSGDHADIQKASDVLGFQPDIMSPHYSVMNPGDVRRAHEVGSQVIPWTVNEEDEIARVIRMGVDGIISDYPDRVVAEVESIRSR